MVRVHLFGIIVASVLVGCTTARQQHRGAYDANLITEDEIVASHSVSAYDAIHKLRANFLSQRGLTSFGNSSSPMPTVYVDEQRYGDIAILRTIPSEIISTIRLYRAWEATTHFGMNNMGGVIAITTRQGGDDNAAWRSRH